MDPDSCYDRWLSAKADGDRTEARYAKQDLKEWLARGGFEPKWTKAQRAAFMKAPKRSKTRSR